MTTRARRKPRAQAEASPPLPPRRVLVGRIVVEEDPRFDPADLCGPILLRGLDDRAGRYAVYATMHDKMITIVSDDRPPLRVTLGSIAEAMLTGRPKPRRRGGG